MIWNFILYYSALRDKEREVVHRISEMRNQAAVFWEDKL